MRKKLICLCLACVPLFAYVDLGVWGAQYNLEKPFEFQEPTSPILSDEKIKQSLHNAFKVHIELPDCNTTKDREFDPTVTLDHDIKMPKFNIDVKKGSKFNYLTVKRMERYLIMIDGSDPLQVEFARYYLSKSDVVLYKGSVETFQEWADGHIYVADESFQKAFKTQCLPSVYIQKDNTFIVRELNMKELTKGRE